AGATAVATRARAANAATNRLRVGVIGLGGQGQTHLKRFHEIQDVDLAYVCDVDQARVSAAAERFPDAQAVTDLRQVLDDDSVDAVSIATPDHWHAPAAILACQAGKHVYVEKPCCHSFREGQMLVAAARKHKRVVQHGTQQRSSPFTANAVQLLREGVIGEVLVAKAWNVQRRANIGHVEPSEPPAGFDYDAWVGPAEMVPFRANCHHYTWRWWHNFGSGDLGNDGVHELDYARWGLGVDRFPTRISAIGGKYFFDDDQQFPDTQTVLFEYGATRSTPRPRQLIFEMRLWSTNYPNGVDSGVEFYGTKGKMFVSKRGKLDILLERNKRIDVTQPENPVQFASPDHYSDFIDAIRESRSPNAEIEIGFYTAALANFGNVATRLGRTLNFDADSSTITNDEEATKMLQRTYRREGHWAVPTIA
ncbi:MAG: Gfo/Idh/MocA family oxidoreductase, partial [Planctomycetales bacterium]|nr:Gfo/Idh/MocA family oxidoreductase [Planctomycetales bacterium]